MPRHFPEEMAEAKNQGLNKLGLLTVTQMAAATTMKTVLKELHTKKNINCTNHWYTLKQKDLMR